LKLLSEAQDILGDDKLIVALDSSGETGKAIKERMEGAEKTMKEIREATELFRPVATRGAILYFVVADMALIDPMYQWSLQYFVGLFVLRMQKCEQSEDVHKRIELLIEDITRNVFLGICRGIFEDHKMMFSFMITANILRQDTKITPMEWLFYLRGAEAALGVLEDFEPTPHPDWCEEHVWRTVSVLDGVAAVEGSGCAGLAKDIQANSAEWKSFVTADDMCSRPFPKNWDSKLTWFQRMLVIRSFRENFGNIATRNFVGGELGKLYTESPPFDLIGSYEDSNSCSPIIFVLSAGADPTDQLLRLAKSKGFDERLHMISLGQGQGPKAEAMVAQGVEDGDWVCLQNCHLAGSWMPTLERIQEQMDPDKVAEEYRLWLTSMPSSLFPVPVLQSGIKITNEPPKGLKANMKGSFATLSEEKYESSPKARAYKKLVFATCFFHAVILERRKFGPIGWNIQYEWMDSDREVSIEQVGMYLASQEGIPFETLNYCVAKVNYGGRVTDDKDVRLISAILRGYFREELLDDSFKLTPLDTYYAPPEGTLAETVEYLESLPLDEDPRVFGLHQNALITAQVGQVRDFLATVTSVQPRISSSGTGKSSEEIVTDMAADLLDRIPNLGSKKQAHAKTFEMTESGMVSLGVFFGQERVSFEILHKKVKASLEVLGRAIKGLVVMSSELEDMFNNFLLQKLPKAWAKAAYPCLKPLASWVQDFMDRIGFMNRWLLEGPPMSFWVPCFFFPQGFMTAAMQMHARATKIAIDDLVWVTDVTSTKEPGELTGPASSGVNVHGFFLEGCGWNDADGLAESEMGVLFVSLPVVWLKPTKRSELVADKEINNVFRTSPPGYLCPLYKTSERKGTLSTTGHSTNFVMYAELRTSSSQDHWICRGVALLCMLDT